MELLKFERLLQGSAIPNQQRWVEVCEHAALQEYRRHRQLIAPPANHDRKEGR